MRGGSLTLVHEFDIVYCESSYQHRGASERTDVLTTLGAIHPEDRKHIVTVRSLFLPDRAYARRPENTLVELVRSLLSNA